MCTNVPSMSHCPVNGPFAMLHDVSNTEVAYAVSISLGPMQVGVELGHLTTRVLVAALCCRGVDCRIVAMFKTLLALICFGQRAM